MFYFNAIPPSVLFMNIFLLWAEYQLLRYLLMTKYISFKSYIFKKIYIISFIFFFLSQKSLLGLSLTCVYMHTVVLPTENIHYRTIPGSFLVYRLCCFNIYISPLKTKLILYQYAGSDGGAHVLGTVLGHGLLWNPQASELLCVLSVPGDSEGIPD